MIEHFKDKTILVTGGTGSIGRALVLRLLKCDPHSIRIFSRNENNQYDLNEYLNDDRCRYLIGDIRDKQRLRLACEDVDYIFHTAALKHVPLCEYNPFEAVKTNVIGTQNLIDCAIDAPVSHVVAISTDKAVHPVNTMGASKLLAEKLIMNAEKYSGGFTKFCNVRFGNVIDSDGGVLNKFTKHALINEPLTVTHREMRRFIMTTNEAIELVLKAYVLSSGGETFILKMPAIRILDLAECIIEYYGSASKIQITTPRDGEKLHESLLVPDEGRYTQVKDGMYIVDYKRLGGQVHRMSYSTEDRGVMSKESIMKFLEGLLGRTG